ncbi:hypothetical protein EV421DRAFT_1908261 [Armillaria borealis]|uniref:Uncharacterized protein n=1 Tax=Armillaria borealis TaxID=47425 RepID=A0AA39MJH5_9AGAR|nr:hypothetical protein EV421DRAFT_1908261 [Armillaria borealis]
MPPKGSCRTTPRPTSTNATPTPSPADGKSTRKPLSIHAPRKSGLPPLSMFVKETAPQPSITAEDKGGPVLTETVEEGTMEVQVTDDQESGAEEVADVAPEDSAVMAESAMRKRKSIDETKGTTAPTGVEDPFFEAETSPPPSPLPDLEERREQKKPQLQESDEEDGLEDTADLVDYGGMYDDIDDNAAMKAELRRFEAELIAKYRCPTPVPSPVWRGSLSSRERARMMSKFTHATTQKAPETIPSPPHTAGISATQHSSFSAPATSNPPAFRNPFAPTNTGSTHAFTAPTPDYTMGAAAPLPIAYMPI